MEFRESPTEQRAKAKGATAVVETEAIETEVVEAKPKASVTKPTKTTTRARSGSLNAEMVVYYLTGVVELLLGIRLILAITNPNGSNGFIYTIVDPLTRPFYDLFYTTGGHEPGVGIILLSMLVYGLLGWGVGRLLRPTSRRS